MTDGAPPGWPERAERLGRAAETGLLTLVLGSMVLLSATQIALRNFWGGGIAWADEALRILVLWVAMLGAVAAARDQRHVSIDAVSRYLPLAWRGPVARLVDLFAASTCGILAWCSWSFFADAWNAGDRVFGAALPAWAVQAILPAGFALLAYRYAVAFVAGRRRAAQGAGGH